MRRSVGVVRYRMLQSGDEPTPLNREIRANANLPAPPRPRRRPRPPRRRHGGRRPDHVAAAPATSGGFTTNARPAAAQVARGSDADRARRRHRRRPRRQALVDVEIYDADGVKVYQRAWDDAVVRRRPAADVHRAVGRPRRPGRSASTRSRSASSAPGGPRSSTGTTRRPPSGVVAAPPATTTTVGPTHDDHARRPRPTTAGDDDHGAGDDHDAPTTTTTAPTTTTTAPTTTTTPPPPPGRFETLPVGAALPERRHVRGAGPAGGRDPAGQRRLQPHPRARRSASDSADLLPGHRQLRRHDRRDHPVGGLQVGHRRGHRAGPDRQGVVVVPAHRRRLHHRSVTAAPPATASASTGGRASAPSRSACSRSASPYHGIAFPGPVAPRRCNLDYAMATRRNCFEGNETWLNQFERGRDYAAGDMWGCVGLWFSGRWYTAAVGHLHRRRADVSWPTGSGRRRASSAPPEPGVERRMLTRPRRTYSGGTATARARGSLATSNDAGPSNVSPSTASRSGPPRASDGHRRHPLLAVLRAAHQPAGEDLEHEAGARQPGAAEHEPDVERAVVEALPPRRAEALRRVGPVADPAQPDERAAGRRCRGRAAPSGGARGPGPRRGPATCRAGAAAPRGRRRPRCSRRS